MKAREEEADDVFHVKELQYRAQPTKLDPLYARKLQELMGGQYGEMTVVMQHLFRGWNCRGTQKHRDMLMDIATEDIGHVGMLAAMIARLLEGVPLKAQEEAVEEPPAVGAVLGCTNTTDAILAGMDPQRASVAGLGATPRDSNRVPWNGAFIVVSGNLAADFRSNLNAESQGLFQAVRPYEMTDDPACATCSPSTSPATPCTRTSGLPRWRICKPRGWRTSSSRTPSRATACCSRKPTPS